MLLGAPLALGSYVAPPAFLLVIPPIVYRLINEEKVLRRDLPGYVDYCRQRRFRLVPGVW
jgi:protein-S-isoprenylcysteine O-methyltransferase Ste14